MGLELPNSEIESRALPTESARYPHLSLFAYFSRLSLGMAFATIFRQAQLSFPLHRG